jgi:hypothetical protein
MKPRIPFYQMNLQQLKAYFIKDNPLERKRKTRRKHMNKKRKTVKKNITLFHNVRTNT